MRRWLLLLYPPEKTKDTLLLLSCSFLNTRDLHGGQGRRFEDKLHETSFRPMSGKRKDVDTNAARICDWTG
jgi:hypothetical protein